MRFLDLFYDPYYGMQGLFGSVGECIQDNGDGTYEVLPPADPNMDPGTWKWTSTFADLSPFYIADYLELTLGADMQALASQNAVYDPYNDVRPEDSIWPLISIKYEDEDNKELALIRTDLDSVFLTKYAEWVVNGGIEGEWDSYLESVKAAGIDRAIEIMQKYYDEYASNN